MYNYLPSCDESSTSEFMITGISLTCLSLSDDETELSEAAPPFSCLAVR